MSVIDEVKQRIDIVDVVGQYVRLTKSGRTLRGLCPFHSEKHPSFFVYPEQQSWHCFGACNTGGDVFSFVMKKEDIDFGETLRLLAQKAGVTLSTKAEPKAKEKEKLYQVNQAAAQYFHDLLIESPESEKARNYVASRGLSIKTVTEFQLGISPNKWEALKQHLLDIGYAEAELSAAGLVIESETGETHDRFRNRLMFPICDIRGRVIGFGARALDDSMPKYLNSPETPIFDKSGSLYGINLAKAAIRKQEMVVIVEGYMDAITAHQNGFDNVVASMGTAVTEKQVSTIKRLTKNMIFALDADEAGEEAMLRGVGYENTLDAEVKVIIIPKGKDPDDVIKEDADTWRSLLEKALPIVDYTFNMATAELDLNTAKGKSSAVDKLLPIIAEIKNPVRQAHYLQKLARMVNVTERNLEAALKSIKPSRGRRQAEEPRQEAITQALRPVFARPREEYCLELLLQHPELKGSSQHPPPEYFESSENREIFVAWQKVDDLSSLKEQLDPTIREYVDRLAAKSLPPNQIEEKYADCVRRLREAFLRGLVTKAEAALAAERELGGAAAELAKLEEQGIEVIVQLGEVFAEKGRKARSKGGEK
ncbi:MAG: DNA primase [Dehalococcoidia bacterium]|nr:MAG: DNA primase [Dehalococcoidia bacterium]